jgi:ABC-type bacteriocin/lantibiotic exporter with double-glycine peptidase domain
LISSVPLPDAKPSLSTIQGCPGECERMMIVHTVRYRGEVIVIDDGKVVEEGTHQQLLDLRGFYHHLYVSQFKGQQI